MQEGKKNSTLPRTVSVLLVVFEPLTKSDGDAQVSKVHNFCESGQESEDLSEPILFNEFIDIKIRYGIDLYIS